MNGINVMAELLFIILFWKLGKNDKDKSDKLYLQVL